MLRVLYSIAAAVIVLAALCVFLPSAGKSNAQTSDNDAAVYDNQTELRPGKKMTVPKAALDELNARLSKTNVSFNSGTGAVNFIRLENNFSSDLTGAAKNQDADNLISAAEKSAAFFRSNAQLFGIAETDASLQMQKEDADEIGSKHLKFQQSYNGVPVFGGEIRTHFDKNNNLYAVGGNVVPEIDVDVIPQRSSSEAINAAIAKVAEDTNSDGLKSGSEKLYVFRTGLVQGISGEDRLVWEVTVTNGASVREYVYIDAHSGKFVEQFTGTPDALNRRAFDGANSASNPPPNYPGTPFWLEGQAFPTASTEANNMIRSSKETYDFYNNAFGRDSFNGTGATMDAIFNRGYDCPNASWNGQFISFCPGLTSDDVTSHEWSHAYTEYTHDLIYAWQPGALNESYSDIFGETVDRINGNDISGNSATDPARVAGSCSVFTAGSTNLVVNSPAVIAGTNTAGPAAFGPALTPAGVTQDVVLALDPVEAAAGSTNTDGCSPLTNGAAVNGKIAFIDRGGCTFKTKVLNAQNAGAVGVIIANVATSTNTLITMADDTTITTPITIPSVLILLATATPIRAQLGNNVNATLRATSSSYSPSTRWLLGEDDTGALAGPLRDMYNPNCYSDPGRVSDTTYYTCSTADGGGVHTNSGVPNHAYALLVDGGTYNGQTVTGIGLTKAAHIYFRAQRLYQTPTSDFAFHADSIERAANDLVGINLNGLTTGAPSGESITAADVQQVKNAALAVELRTKPTFCNFQPLLAQSPPADPACAVPGTSRLTVFGDDFETNGTTWTNGISNTVAGNTLPNWTISSTLPNRAGKGFFAANPNDSCSASAPDQTALRFLTSPTITIPANYSNSLRLAFDHYVSTEAGYDGGQVLYSVNGGAFTLVPTVNYVYNAPNATLISAAATPPNSNPQAGQRAWSGADGGSVVGTFGRTVVDLTSLAPLGGTIQLRWTFGNDICSGSTLGWYLDNVRLSACLTASPTAANGSIAGRVVTGGGRGIANAVVVVTDANGVNRTARTNSFGNFRVADLPSGATYNISVRHKTYTFAPAVVSLGEDLSDVIIRANP